MATVLKPGTAFIWNGVKATPISELPDSAWVWYSGQLQSDVETRYKGVPWLFRAVNIRADAVSRLPFSIVTKSGDEFDSSHDYQNKLGFLPNPRALLWLVEAALCLLGRAYVLRERNRVKTLGLRYLLPTSIEPKYDEDKGLVGFTRSIGARTVDLATDDLVYFWAPNPFGELGPGTAPADTALVAAGVLYNADVFADSYFQRGLVKATLLTVEGNPPEQEKRTLKNWWSRLFKGIDKAWTTEVVSANVKPVVVGEGLKDLENVTLTREKKEDIATALGIPHTLLFSDAANYATAEQDDKHFYSKTVVPEGDIIAEVLNAQVLTPMGLRWEFNPETLDVFQTDEESRATAFLQYTQGGLPAWIAGQILGVELPEGVTWEELKPKEPLAVEPVVPQDSEAVQQFARLGEVRADLDKWRRVSLKRLREGKPAAYDFESEVVPDAMRAAILAALETATTAEEVKAAFAAPFCRTETGWGNYP